MTSFRFGLSGWRDLSRETRLLLVMNTVFGLGYGGIGIMLRPLYVLRLGLGAEYYGLYSAAGSFAYMAMSFAAGWLGTRLGARRAMIIGAVGCLAGTALMPLAESFGPVPVRALPLASNLVLSAAWALVGVNLVPAVTGVTAEANRDRAIGLANTLNGAGILAGNLLGGVLPRLCSGLLGTPVASNHGFRLSLALVLLFGVAMLGVMLALPERAAQQRRRLGSEEPLRWTPLLVVALFGLLLPAASAGVSTYAVPYLDQDLRLSTEAIGLITTAGQALAVLGMMLTPWLATRLTSRRATMLVGLGAALSLLPMAALPHWAAAVFGRTMSGAFNMMRISIMQMYAMAQVSQGQRALMSGILSAATGVCFTAISYLGGWLAASSGGYRAVFWVTAAITGVATVGFGLVTATQIKRGRLARG